jgi:hypothetical protein
MTVTNKFPYAVNVSGVVGDCYGAVDAEDRLRAETAAETVLRDAGVTAADAEAAYIAHVIAEDGESSTMRGLAFVWLKAILAADAAITSTWSNRSAYVACELTAHRPMYASA